MKRLMLFLVFVAGVSSFAFLDHDYERTPLGDSIDKATLKLLREAYKSSEDKNVITSPLGVMILLSIYANGAGAISQDEISRVLGGGNKDFKDVSESFSHLSEQFAAMNPDYLTLANRIYVQNGLALNSTFENIARTYKSDVKNIDFTDTKKAAEVINQWADETTKGNIKKPIDDGVLNPDVVLGLFNIIFFQGHWHVPFQVNNTKDEDFHVDKTTTVKKPTMSLLQPLFYNENKDLGVRMIELPYKETGFRMVVVLPDEVDGLPAVLDKVAEKGLLEDVFRLGPSGRDIDLHFPKFEVRSKLDLNQILPKVGVSKMFEEPATGIVNGDPVVVSKAFQEAFVKVDEEGATAGAFTGVLFVVESLELDPPTPIDFKADHPFLFYILYQDKVLFAGTYTH